MTTEPDPVQAEKTSPSLWRVTLENPPINMFDPEMIDGLRTTVAAAEEDPNVKVLVFESADPEFFIGHFDLVRANDIDRTPGPTGMPAWPDIALRFERAAFITIAKVRGRARGVGSEFIQAMDLVYASSDNAILSQPEVGMGFIPGGGGMERLYRRTGRARALEIILTGFDYDADAAERYGWINRAVADSDLDEFVERIAERIAGFDASAIATAKEILREHAGTPEPEELVATEGRFYELLAAPAAQEKVASLLEAGLQTRGPTELNLADALQR